MDPGGARGGCSLLLTVHVHFVRYKRYRPSVFCCEVNPSDVSTGAHVYSQQFLITPLTHAISSLHSGVRSMLGRALCMKKFEANLTVLSRLLTPHPPTFLDRAPDGMKL